MTNPEVQDALKDIPPNEFDTQCAEVTAINGRGDPIPESPNSVPSSGDLSELARLVDSVIEVGIVDLYDAQTDLPLRFLDKAMQTLERNAIPLPALADQTNEGAAYAAASCFYSAVVISHSFNIDFHALIRSDW